ncbi:hypothetical protein Cgig2_002215 [Carnegiea gigantea]|uniref:Uncharacterized protein n=1 Tax=Carnegiea gigantea TaxID=171969 RepID=A0A9Q1GWC9_9CARY|nr:hypothetical protein Cgig2_002215 [Carnegiea gigantea]
MFISSTYSPHVSDSKRKQSDLSGTNISKEEGKLGSNPKLKIVRTGKPLEPFVPPMEDGSSHLKIPGIDVATPAIPIPTIPIQNIAPITTDKSQNLWLILLLMDMLPIRVCEPIIKNVIELSPEGAEYIMDILNDEPNSTECMDLFDSRSRLDGSKGVCSLNNDEVESICKANAPSLVSQPQYPLRAPRGGMFVFNTDTIIKEVDENAAWVFDKVKLDKLSCTPFNGLPFLKGDFDNLYATILQRGVNVTPSESKVKGLIKQACDFKDIQHSYTGRTSTEEQDSRRMEVQGKFDKASHRLNTKGAHYKAKATELKQVAASKHLLQEIKLEVIDFQVYIDIISATELMDAATKATLEKIEAFIKESFEDLKNFQWKP